MADPTFVRGAYGYIEESIVGLLDGIDHVIEGQWIAPDAGIEFGSPCFAYPGDENQLVPYVRDVNSFVLSANLVTGNSIVVTINGTALSAVAFGTSHAATMQSIVTAINNADADAVVVGTNNRTLLVRTKEDTADVSVAITGGATQATATKTTGSSLTFVGVSTRTQNSAGIYEQYDAVDVVVHGRVNASVTGEVVANSPVGINSEGKLVENAENISQVDANFRSNTSGDGLAVVQVVRQSPLEFTANFV